MAYAAALQMERLDSMNSRAHMSQIVLSISVLLLTVGCGERSPASAKRGGDAGKMPGQVADHGHDHAHECEEGPHGGQVVELAGKYHAEVVPDEKRHKVTVYLLDAKAKGAVAIAIDEPDVFVNAVVNGKPSPHRLTAARQQTDPEGEASRFELIDVPLFETLFETEGGKGRLRVTIGGKQFVGDIEHCEHKEHEHHDHKTK
jgi:hypothetical protein